MWYEINVSKDGVHFFATHERSIQTKEKLAEILTKFRESFSESEGFEISVRKMSKVGESFSDAELEEMLNKK